MPRKVSGGCFLSAGTSSRISLDWPFQGCPPQAWQLLCTRALQPANTPMQGGRRGGTGRFPPHAPRRSRTAVPWCSLCKLPTGISKPLSEERAAGETEAQWERGLQKAPYGDRPHLLLPAPGSRYHTALPDLLGVTPADLTSSVGENLTRTLHRCPGARAPAEGSALKTQGLAFNSWSSFRRTLAGKCLST